MIDVTTFKPEHRAHLPADTAEAQRLHDDIQGTAAWCAAHDMPIIRMSESAWRRVLWEPTDYYRAMALGAFRCAVRRAHRTHPEACAFSVRFGDFRLLATRTTGAEGAPVIMLSLEA